MESNKSEHSQLLWLWNWRIQEIVKRQDQLMNKNRDLILWSESLNFETNISYFGPDPIYENYEVLDVGDLYNKVIYSNHQQIFLSSVLMYSLLLFC